MGDEWWMKDQLREMAAENVASSVAEEEVAEVFRYGQQQEQKLRLVVLQRGWWRSRRWRRTKRSG
jgi:hypothetical protein